MLLWEENPTHISVFAVVFMFVLNNQNRIFLKWNLIMQFWLLPCIFRKQKRNTIYWFKKTTKQLWNYWKLQSSKNDFVLCSEANSLVCYRTIHQECKRCRSFSVRINTSASKETTVFCRIKTQLVVVFEIWVCLFTHVLKSQQLKVCN